jgi:alkylhydroperoxidase family enzyme
MTWVPVETGGLAERDAVLGLKPEQYSRVRDTLAVLWGTTDPDLLDLVRLRLAQLTRTRAELAGADGELLADLEDWDTSPRFGERERAALAYAEQYHYDHRSLADEQKAELARHLSRSEVVNFVWALHMNDSYIRILSLLDVAPDPPGFPPRPERTPMPGTPARQPSSPRSEPGPDDLVYEDQLELMEPAFRELYLQLNAVIVRENLIDPVSSEAIRLHNAGHQGCLY